MFGLLAFFLFLNVSLYWNLLSLLKVKLIVNMQYDLVVDSYEFHLFHRYLHLVHFE